MSCSLTNCGICRTGKYAIKEKNVGLNETLKSEAVKALAQSLLVEADKAVTEAEGALREAQTFREGIRKLVGEAGRALAYYFIPGRSYNSKGHFIQLFDGPNTSCTCDAIKGGRQCWARKWVVAPTNTVARGKYVINSDLYNGKVKPYVFGEASRAPANNAGY